MTIHRPQLLPSYTPPEIAKSFRVDVKLVRQWIATGKLRAMNIALAGSPKYRVTPASLAAFTERMEKEHATSIQAKGVPQRASRRREAIPNLVRE